MSHVRGPFIEYDCYKCGCGVQQNASFNKDRLIEHIVALNSDPSTRLCAGCDGFGAIEKARADG